MVSDELRRQADDFIDIKLLQERIGRSPVDRMRTASGERWKREELLLSAAVQAVVGLRIRFRVRGWPNPTTNWELTELQHELVNVLA